MYQQNRIWGWYSENIQNSIKYVEWEELFMGQKKNNKWWDEISERDISTW